MDYVVKPCTHDPSGTLKCNCVEWKLLNSLRKVEDGVYVEPHPMSKGAQCDQPTIRKSVPVSTFTADSDALVDEDQTFQMDDDQILREVSCAGCKGKSFEIFTGSYWTGIRCSACGVESTIHSG